MRDYGSNNNSELNSWNQTAQMFTLNSRDEEANDCCLDFDSNP